MSSWSLAMPILALAIGVGTTPAQAQLADSAAVGVAEKFMAALQSGDWSGAEGMIAPAVRDRLGATQLETVWGQLHAGLGELKGTRLRAVTPADSLKAVELYGDFAAQTVLMRIVVTPALEVSGFWVGPVPPESETAGPVQAPPYADTSKFREEEVQIGADPWRLPGTLTLPGAPGPHAAVVLVHGSGPHDRDETVGGAKVFRDLAWGLATRGVAVLRYDKRTKVHGAKMGADVTVETEVIEDAVAALDLLRAHPSIDPAQVYLLGHSLGAQLGPEVARRGGNVAGAILLAAPARPLEVVMLAQLEYLAGLPLNAAPAAQAQLTTAAEQVRRLASEATPDTEVILGAPASYFRDLRKYDPVAGALRTEVPLLILQGERDYQVTMEDFAIWRTGMKDRPATSLRSFPGLNHLFVTGSGPATPAEYAQPGFVSADVIDAIAAWIRR